ncbi:Rabenosyn-5 [Hypsibius exemplaris]|uniref:Rabenosyn-5 n=1 Tax=Hypsibius exemplaris TaxID=2072580 RepID=A0A9X6NNC9_HYPEX|nr:Rabenosyn-5 [Hypsibius exemplaris]
MSRSVPRSSLTPQRPTAAEVVVREGFICPICMQDLGTIDELQEHFERDHTEEDKSILQQLKGMLLKKVGRSTSPTPERRNGGGGLSDDEGGGFHNDQLITWDPQDDGDVTSHTEYFRKIRDNRMERFMVETNKLIIRLDKLVHEAPSDPRQRAVFEKHLASWVPDHDVPVCPGCGKTFKRFMRKHHCRLCGCVICTECSRFLDEAFVERLTNPVGAALSRSDDSSRRGSDTKPGPGMKRSNSSESLMSIMASMGSKDKEQVVRACEICRGLLDRRLKQMDEKYEKTELEELNERIVFAISDAENLYPGYQEMAASLHAGETNFQLQQAVELRNQLMRLFDTVDLFGKRVAALPETTSPVEQKLRSKIRMNAMDFLKSHVLSMSVLPSPEKCEELQRTRREEIKRNMAAKRAADDERKRQLLSRNNHHDSPLSARKKPDKPKTASKNPFDRSTQKGSSSNPFEEDESDNDDSLNPFAADDDEEVPPKTKRPETAGRQNGWAAEPVRADELDQDDDPVLQQIEIVKKTIEQAKRAGRMDEVLSLSQNLSDLTLFYKQQVLQQL